MYALFVSLLFTVAFIGSIGVIVAMLRTNFDKIITALVGEHLPAGFKAAPILVNAPRRGPRTVRRLAPPPSLAQIRRAAAA